MSTGTAIIAVANENDLVVRAQNAVQKYPHSDIEVAMAVCPTTFLSESNDRLLKLGRRITNLIQSYNNHITTTSTKKNQSDTTNELRSSLQLLIDECHLLLTIRTTNFKVPTVRFGKTNLQMPIVTLGCMRFQQEWGPRITNMNQVHSDCQDNLVAILHCSIVQYGMYHIETARGYGCSELQLGVALQQLYRTTTIQRSDLIIQTKIPPNPDPVSFREAIEMSMKLLQVDYVDLLALHGMNYDEQYEWVFGQNGNNNMNIIQEYVMAGKIRHVGFSTHGSNQFIMKCINTDRFEYVNLHYHYFGSYTASGLGPSASTSTTANGTGADTAMHHGNFECIQLLAKKDIGRFIISPYDKGGRLYAPSKKLLNLTLPDMEPITFASLWLWNHHKLYTNTASATTTNDHDKDLQLHTFTVGVARPSDLDQPMMAAYLHATQSDVTLTKLKTVTERLDAAKELALGKEWLTTWYQGLIKNTESKHLVEHNQIVWIYNTINAFGMYEFGKARYNSFEKNNSKWDETKTKEENITIIGKNGWGFVPGRPLKRYQVNMGLYMDEDLIQVPELNRLRVKEAEEFVYQWCRDRSLDEKDTDHNSNKRDNKGGFLRRSIQALKKGSSVEEDTSHDTNTSSSKNNGSNTTTTTQLPLVESSVSSTLVQPLESTIPDEWQTAYDLRTWPDFPDQPSRA